MSFEFKWDPQAEEHAVGVSVGGDDACALLSTGRIKCWGDNSAGDLGNDATTQSDIPVKVLLI